MIYQGAEIPTIYSDAPQAATRTFDQPPEKVWEAIKRAHFEYSVPLTVDNPPAHQLGNPDFYRTRQFAGRPMTELLSCGSGITGPNAASYRIYMSLLTTVTANGKGGSIVATTFTATARDISGGASGDRLPCGSSGIFEGLFLERVRVNVGS